MNTFGRKFRVTVFGESHGEVVGVVLDGVPAGLELSEADFDRDIARRKSGAKGTTERTEADEPRILSGVFEGYTTGAPIAIIFHNMNTRPRDYSQFAAMPRPGHADQAAAVRWDDCNDPRGGGHFSGRLTLPVVAAGVVAKKILADTTILDETPVPENGIRAQIVELGGIPACHAERSETSVGEEILRSAQDDRTEGQDDIVQIPDLVGNDGSGDDESGGDESGGDGACMPKEWQEAIERAMEEGDSLGAVIDCVVPRIEPGYGEPFWDSVESQLAHAIFAIPGVRGIEFGDGFKAAAMRGSEHNDPIGEDGRPTKNGAGGVNGGLTNGAPLKFRVAFKPTSSIAKSQQTFNFATGQMDTLEVKGRHDACFALRCPVIVEAMTAIALADLALLR